MPKTRDPRPPTWITHSCGARWLSRRIAHCASCHRHFAGTEAFDTHRRGGVCHDPGSLTTENGEPRLTPRTDQSGATYWGAPLDGEADE